MDRVMLFGLRELRIIRLGGIILLVCISDGDSCSVIEWDRMDDDVLP